MSDFERGRAHGLRQALGLIDYLTREAESDQARAQGNYNQYAGEMAEDQLRILQHIERDLELAIKQDDYLVPRT